MNNLSRSLIVLALFGSIVVVVGQQRTGLQSTAPAQPDKPATRQAVQDARLKKLFSKVGVEFEPDAIKFENPGYRQIKIGWRNSALAKSPDNAGLSVNASEPQVAELRVIQSEEHVGALPRHRSLEFSSTHILIAAVSRKNQLRWWTIIPDPRVVRAEFPAADGQLKGETLSNFDFTLDVAYPDDPNISGLRFYHPVWNGTDFDLRLLATTAIN
jgi:hypothetical protein